MAPRRRFAAALQRLTFRYQAPLRSAAMAAGDKRYLEFVVLGRPGQATRRYRISRGALISLLLALPILGLSAGYALGNFHAHQAHSAAASTPAIPVQSEHVARVTAPQPVQQLPAPAPAAMIATAEQKQQPTAPAPAAVEAVPTGEPLRIVRGNASEEVIEVHPFAADGAARASDFDQLGSALACADGHNQKPDVALVRVLVAAQHHFGKPLLFLGGRCPAHKDHVDTEEYHRTGRAADVRVQGVPSDELMAWAVQRGAGGAGRYKQAGFVHIDVRPGAPEQWRGEETPAPQKKPQADPDAPAAAAPEPATQPTELEAPPRSAGAVPREAAKPDEVPEATP